jgi:endonuclease YncB( thermonuclease family)
MEMSMSAFLRESRTRGARAGVLPTVLVVLQVVGTGPGWAAEGSVEATVVEVVDGDSLIVETANGTVQVDLIGIDAPELEQKWGAEAREFLIQLAADGPVVIGTDHPGETVVASVDVGGRDLSRAMAEAGFAWIADTGVTLETYAAVVFTARSGRRGMWVDDYSTLVHPARWREQNLVVPTPLPATPTPLPNPLSRYAQTTALAADDEEVAIAGIPTKEVRRREERRLEGALRQLESKHNRVEYLVDRIEERCDTTGSTSEGSTGDATYWSDEEQRWVSAPPRKPPPECARDRDEVFQLRSEISQGKQAAVNRATRFGLSPGYIRKKVRAFDLEEY